MKSFNQFILESYIVEEVSTDTKKDGNKTDENSSNTAFGDAFETAAVLHLHNNTAAKHNPDKVYQSTIEQVGITHREAMAKLRPKRQETALSYGVQAGKSYLGSLKKEDNISPNHINEVHHTKGGITKHMGGILSNRTDNPHDLLVKGSKQRTSFIHGASLKATSKTVSNNSLPKFQRESADHGMNLDVSKHWKKAEGKAGFTGMTREQKIAFNKNNTDNYKTSSEHDKSRANIAEINTQAKIDSASDHDEAFQGLSLSNKKKHLLHFLKNNPHVPYHYVVGKTGASYPIQKHPAIIGIKNAKSITSRRVMGVIHFHDENGNRLAQADHRAVHGPITSPQVNFSFGDVR